MSVWSFLVALTLLTGALGSDAKFCQVTPSAITGLQLVSSPYTGVRVFRHESYRFSVLHHWFVVYCNKGKAVRSQFFPATRDSSFPWTEPLCLSDKVCIKLARRKRYAQRELPLYLGGTFVGGLFDCKDDHQCTDPTPLLPLMAANSAQAITKLERFSLSRYRWLFETDSLPVPFIDLDHDGPAQEESWSASIDVNEQYEYTPSDRYKLWYFVNYLVNKIANANAKANAKVTNWPWTGEQFDSI